MRQVVRAMWQGIRGEYNFTGRCIGCGKDRDSPTGKKCSRCKEIARKSVKGHFDRAREAVFDHYGRVCSCCGESEFQFLTLDHVDGRNPELDPKGGVSLYASLVRRARLFGWPTNLRTLCFNCNCGRQRNGGVCPHQVDT